MTEIYLAQENIIAGTYERAPFLTLEAAIQAASEKYGVMEWRPREKREFEAYDVVDSADRRVSILILPIGVWTEDSLS